MDREETQSKFWANSVFQVLLTMVFVLTLFPIKLFAANEDGNDEFIPTGPMPQERNWEKAFIESNIAISEWFDSAADGLDMFLVGRRMTKTKNKTSIRMENSTFSAEGKNDVINSTGFRVQLNLPNVEKYLHLKFTSYDEREEQRNVKRSYLRQSPRPKNYGATVGFLQKTGKIRTKFEPRIELQDPLKISHSLEFASVIDMGGYQFNPKLEFFASPSRGVGAFQGLNFNFVLSDIWNLTLINEAEYQEKKHLAIVINGVSFGQSLSSKTSLSYTALAVSNNRPVYHLDSYNFSVAWNETLYKKVLDYQIIPNYEFSKAEGFKGRLGITANINLNF